MAENTFRMPTDEDPAVLVLGDCLEVMPGIPDDSIDCMITDPPYPEIDRDYGRWTETQWWNLMMEVVRETRRVLKPHGSAVFVLQPNSRKAGSMRGWLWRFMLWVCDEWNMVQDAYWWNTSTLPIGGANAAGLMRPSLKYMMWCGPPGCWRDQDTVLEMESTSNRRDRIKQDFKRKDCPSRRRTPTEGPRDDYQRLRTAVERRGGVVPFNVRVHGSDGRWGAGMNGHPAGTPAELCSWWVRYICPPGGTVLDPFSGSGTVTLAALAEGRKAIGIERDPSYHAIASRRVHERLDYGPLFEAPPASQPLLFAEEDAHA